LRIAVRAALMPFMKKASASPLPPWRYGVATSSSVFGVVSRRNRSGQTLESERLIQT